MSDRHAEIPTPSTEPANPSIQGPTISPTATPAPPCSSDFRENGQRHQSREQYHLRQPIRRDQETITYSACTSTGRVVALRKWLEAGTLGDTGRALTNEIRRFAQVSHPNLAAAVDFGLFGNTVVLVTELPDGESLSRVLSRNGPLPVKEAVRLCTTVSEAVRALHAGGVLHRRIRPANITRTRHGRAVLWPARFPACGNQAFGDLPLGEALGIVQYMAPETIVSEERASERSDVYSLAATLYMLVTGDVPFPADSIQECFDLKSSNRLPSLVENDSRGTDESVPPGVIAAIRSGLQADPRNRPASVSRFIELIRDGLESVGPYTLIEQVGRGESGKVYRALAPGGRTVAVKILERHDTGDKRRRMRFYQEAKLAMQVDHPNLVKVLEVGDSGGRHYIVMEYVEGENLARHIMRSGKISERKALQLSIDVAGALGALHARGIVHRDVNPGNIMIDRQGRGILVDLGLSKQPESDLELTRLDTGLGTLPYMAPEQFRHASEASARFDVYGLGATLYTILTGTLPFQGTAWEVVTAKVKNQYTRVEEAAPSTSPSTAKLVRRAMHPAPARRLENVERFLSLASTCLAVASGTAATAARATVDRARVGKESVWHVVFFNASGQSQRLRATTSQVLQLLRMGRLGADARAMYPGQRDFRPLHEIPAFAPYFKGVPARTTSPSALSRFFGGWRKRWRRPNRPVPRPDAIPDSHPGGGRRWLRLRHAVIAPLIWLVGRLYYY